MPSAPYTTPSTYHTLQGVNSATFHPPPLDGSILIPDLFAYQAERNPEHPVFVYHDGEQGLRTIYMPEAYQAMKRASAIVRRLYLRSEHRYLAQSETRPADQPPTIGVLASADTISYATLLVGIMRLGLAVFPISTRNSPAAVAHLLGKTHVVQLFVSPDPAMQRLASEALELLNKDGIDVELLPMLQFLDVFDRPDDEEVGEDSKVRQLELDSTACIFHSSGSTSFPKPIKLSNRTFVQWATIPWWGKIDLCGVVFGVQPLPMFHAMSSIIIMWTLSCGIVVGCYKPSSPPTVPTPENYLEAIQLTDSRLLYCAPSFVETWFQDIASIPSLKKLSHIVYAGGPLNKQVGDKLVSMGVAIIPLYGITEVGSINMVVPDGVPAADEWEYFKLSGQLEVEMLPQEGADDVFEMTVIEGPYLKPNTFNAKTKDGRNVYRTNDLLQRHPRDPERWKIVGRADDQIMLSTSEKTNPGPLESILSCDPRVQCAVMFGRGRTQNGVLIEPREAYAFDPKDESKLADFRNAIWPTVEKLNEFAPAHSRLFKEMILVSSPDKPFQYTAKGTPRKAAIIEAYDGEIDNLYKAVEESSQTALTPPSDWTPDATLEFVQTVIRQVMERELKEQDDLFQNGCDSLQATWIRNTILRALRQSAPSLSKNLPNNVVYSNPTIRSLASFLSSLFSEGHTKSDAELKTAKIQEMKKMLEKYATGLPSHRPASQVQPESTPVDEVVLLTGSTGRLGSLLLAQLLSRPSVKRVYALNRPSNPPGKLSKRQKEAFAKWRLDEALLTDSGERVILLEADVAAEGLGLPKDVYEEMKASVTSIIHNAWLVNFNIALSSFEPLIAGLRHLIDLSLSSTRSTPPTMLFTSSISVLLNAPPGPAPEQPLSSPDTAIGMGYGESKWIAESLLLRAPLRSTVVRVGQMCGDTRVGGWPEWEWLPVLVRGSVALGALPQRDEMLSWIPVDTAAATLLDFLVSPTPEPVLHIVHPTPVPWATIISHFSAELGLPLIPASEWLDRLRAAHGRGEDASNPALRLLDFFVTAWDSQATLPTTLSTERAVQVSPTLRKAAGEPLGARDVRAWVQFWRDGGYL